MSQKRYSFPTGNVETAERINRGEPLHKVINDIKPKWTPGNEHLWDDYDADSLVDDEEKRQYAVNQLLYCRIVLFRALRDIGKDVGGSDPFEYAEEVPAVLSDLKLKLPDVRQWLP
jgi:hypothetical protein